MKQNEIQYLKDSYSINWPNSIQKYIIGVKNLSALPKQYILQWELVI